MAVSYEEMYLLFFFISVMPVWGQPAASYRQENGKVVFTINDANLHILPLSNNAVRVKYERKAVHHFPEWVHVNSEGLPKYAFTHHRMSIFTRNI